MASSPASRVNGSRQYGVSAAIDICRLRAIAGRKRNRAAVIAAYLKVHPADVLYNANHLRVSQIVVEGDGYRAVPGDDSTRHICGAASNTRTNRNWDSFGGSVTQTDNPKDCRSQQRYSA